MKTKLLSLLSFMLIISINLFAQLKTLTERDFAGNNVDELRCMSTAKDGSVYIGGYSNSNRSGAKSQNRRGKDDYWIIKASYNSTTGKLTKIWDKTIGGSSIDWLFQVIATDDGGCILRGVSTSGISGDKTQESDGQQDGWLVKLDKDGNIQWQSTIFAKDNTNLESIDTTAGGYILALGYNGLRKIDTAGNTIWSKSALAGHFYTSVKSTADGGYIVADVYNDSVGLLKTNNNGAAKWTKYYGKASVNVLNNAVIQTLDDGYAMYYLYINAYFNDNSGQFTYFCNDRYLFKTNQTGKLLWTVHDQNGDAYNGGYPTFGLNLVQMADGNYLFGCSVKSTSGFYPYANDIEKIGKYGHKLWEQVTPSVASIFAIVPVSLNQYLLGGDDDTSFTVNYHVTTVEDTTATAVAAPKILTAFTNNKELSNFTAYPNPVRDILFIRSPQKAVFILTDQTGKTIITTTITGQGQINVSNISSGIYYLKNITSNTSQKIIVIK